MDSIKYNNENNKKHITIKRRNKNQNKEKGKELSFLEFQNLNIFNNTTSKINEKRRINNYNFNDKMSLKIPKVNINLFTINHNNKKSITISSEKNNKPIMCKVHKSKTKKTLKKRNMILDIPQNKKNINHNSIQYINISFDKNIKNRNQGEKNENKIMSFSDYFNIVQQNNLKILNNRVDNLLNKKNLTKVNLQSKYKNEGKINYNIENKIYNNRIINDCSFKIPKPNIYKKKSICQKYSFSKSRTHKNTISDISNLTTEQKVSNKVEPKIYNKLIKNRLKNEKIFKYIPNRNITKNKHTTDLFNTFNSNFINYSHNSTSTVLKNNLNNKTINIEENIENPEELGKKEMNVYSNNYYIYNYINKNNNSFNFYKNENHKFKNKK